MTTNNKTLKMKHKSNKNLKNHNKSIKNLKKNSCSPSSKNTYTCYDDKSLLIMKSLWNRRHPDRKILSANPKDIWESLKNNMHNVCNNEKCLVYIIL